MMCIRSNADSIKPLVSDSLLADTIAKARVKDSIRSNAVNKIFLNKSSYRPDINKVVWRSAILPGYGQIANHQVWKLPIVYGGFVFIGYLVYQNNLGYNQYRRLNNLYLKDKNSEELVSVLKQKGWIDSFGNYRVDPSNLNYFSNAYRTNRDLSIISCVAFYALTVLDAYVYAQLFDYDISPDLSMKITPTFTSNGSELGSTVGVKLCFKLK